MMMATPVRAESRNRALYCKCAMNVASICRSPLWSAIDGATLRRAAMPAVGPCSLIASMRRHARCISRTTFAVRWSKPHAGSYQPGGSPIPTLATKIKLFADGADRAGLLEMNANPLIQGMTTNPTLMRKAGITDYEAFARDILSVVTDKPISLEVFADDFDDMERQATKIASWGDNVYVKIPVSNTKREMAYGVIRKLADRGVRVNVTAMMTLAQVRDVLSSLNHEVPSYVSVFAGRIADTGRDPVPLMAAAVTLASTNPQTEVIWASPRELLNVFQADAIGCQIITLSRDLINKLALVNYDLDEYSLDTVKMFYNDALQAGYRI
jgi:transaldolase